MAYRLSQALPGTVLRRLQEQRRALDTARRAANAMHGLLVRNVFALPMRVEADELEGQVTAAASRLPPGSLN